MFWNAVPLCTANDGINSAYNFGHYFDVCFDHRSNYDAQSWFLPESHDTVRSGGRSDEL